MKAKHEFISEQHYLNYLRDYYAGVALQSILSCRDLQIAIVKDNMKFEDYAIEKAEALIKQLKNK